MRQSSLIDFISDRHPPYVVIKGEQNAVWTIIYCENSPTKAEAKQTLHTIKSEVEQIAPDCTVSNIKERETTLWLEIEPSDKQ